MSQEKTPSQVIDDIISMKESKQKKKELAQEKSKELKGIINKLASNDFGKEFIKLLLNYIEWGKPKTSLDGRQLLVQNGKEMVYLDLIRPYLTETNRKEVE